MNPYCPGSPAGGHFPDLRSHREKPSSVLLAETADTSSGGGGWLEYAKERVRQEAT